MALFYYNQEYKRSLSAKGTSAPAPLRLADLRAANFGNSRMSAELTYVKGQNTDAAGVNRHFSDAWATLAGAQGVTSVPGNKEKRRLFMREENFP